MKCQISLWTFSFVFDSQPGKHVKRIQPKQNLQYHKYFLPFSHGHSHRCPMKFPRSSVQSSMGYFLFYQSPLQGRRDLTLRWSSDAVWCLPGNLASSWHPPPLSEVPRQEVLLPFCLLGHWSHMQNNLWLKIQNVSRKSNGRGHSGLEMGILNLSPAWLAAYWASTKRWAGILHCSRSCCKNSLSPAEHSAPPRAALLSHTQTPLHLPRWKPSIRHTSSGFSLGWWHAYPSSQILTAKTGWRWTCTLLLEIGETWKGCFLNK